jgi:hypothetical protein
MTTGGDAMNTQNEHDDDREPEVVEGDEIEAETYGEAEDDSSGVTEEPTESTPRTEIDEEEGDGEASDTI